MHRLMISILTVCAVILAASMGTAATEAPGDLKLGPPEGMKTTKTMVDFSHAKHEAAKVECATCHHTWDGKSDVQSCAAAGCHDQPGKKGENAYYTAFHFKKSDQSCLGCHKMKRKEGNKKVPVSCKHCHPK